MSKVAQKRNPLDCHSCAKFNPSGLNSCYALRQTAAWHCFIKHCLFQSAYGLHLLLLSDKQLYSSTGLQGGFSPLALIYYGETNKKQKTHLVSPQPTCFYITGYRAFNFRFLSPTWIGFWLFIALKSNQCFLLSVFCFRFDMTDCGFVVGFAWLWGKKRKPCVKQSQNGSVLDLFVAVNRRRKSFRRKLHRSKNWTEWNNFVKIVKRSCIVPTPT